jgi:ABC-2 type transport system ATP-binding protein
MLLKAVVQEEIEKGKIVLFSSHQMNYIEEFCDSIAILNGGRIALSGELYDIKRNYPRNRLVVRSQERERILHDLGSVAEPLENDGLLVTLASPEEKQAMMTRLIDNYDVDEVKVFEPTLNDIFVEYTGDQT